MRHEVNGCTAVSQYHIKLIRHNRSSEDTGAHTVTVTVTIAVTVTVITSRDVIVRKLPLSCSMLRTLGDCHQWLACLEDCDTQTTQP